METYPAFLTPRDKKLSLSSSEEKYSKFGWLEIKMKEKTRIYMKNRASALFLDSIYWITRYGGPLPFTVDAREFIYRGVFPTFLAKKSCGWWLTRRRMEIYTKISEEKI